MSSGGGGQGGQGAADLLDQAFGSGGEAQPEPAKAAGADPSQKEKGAAKLAFGWAAKLGEKAKKLGDGAKEAIAKEVRLMTEDVCELKTGVKEGAKATAKEAKALQEQLARDAKELAKKQGLQGLLTASPDGAADARGAQSPTGAESTAAGAEGPSAADEAARAAEKVRKTAGEWWRKTASGLSKGFQQGADGDGEGETAAFNPPKRGGDSSPAASSSTAAARPAAAAPQPPPPPPPPAPTMGAAPAGGASLLDPEPSAGGAAAGAAAGPAASGAAAPGGDASLLDLGFGDVGGSAASAAPAPAAPLAPAAAAEPPTAPAAPAPAVAAPGAASTTAAPVRKSSALESIESELDDIFGSLDEPTPAAPAAVPAAAPATAAPATQPAAAKPVIEESKPKTPEAAPAKVAESSFDDLWDSIMDEDNK